MFNSDSTTNSNFNVPLDKRKEEKASSLLYLSELGDVSVSRDLNFVFAEECKKRRYLYKRIKIKKNHDFLGLSDHHDFAFDSNQEISWSDFQKGREVKGLTDIKGVQQKSIVLFDLPEIEHEKFEEFVPLLDDWIFLIDAEIDQVMEVYKMIKGTRELNSQVNYHLVFKSSKEDVATLFLRNQMQSILNSRLHCEISNMGCYIEGPGSYLKSESLFHPENRGAKEHVLQKKSFMDYLERNYPSVEQKAV
jgi:hypothetical protein